MLVNLLSSFVLLTCHEKNSHEKCQKCAANSLDINAKMKPRPKKMIALCALPDTCRFFIYLWPRSSLSRSPLPLLIHLCLSRVVTCERLIGPHDLRLIAAPSHSTLSPPCHLFVVSLLRQLYREGALGC